MAQSTPTNRSPTLSPDQPQLQAPDRRPPPPLSHRSATRIILPPLSVLSARAVSISAVLQRGLRLLLLGCLNRGFMSYGSGVKSVDVYTFGYAGVQTSGFHKGGLRWLRR